MITKNSKAGRPPLENNQRSLVVLTVDLIAELEIEAARCSSNRSKLIRQAVREFLDNRKMQEAA